MTSNESAVPMWTKGDGPDADVVISTRARLARRLASYPFPSRASGEDLTMIAREVRAASMGLAKRFPRLRSVSIEKLSREERSFLLDAHVASVEQTRGGEGRMLIVDSAAPLSIMVNEEDHVRLQVVMSGLVCEEAWELVDWADDVLSEKLDYGCSERYGYLTASVSNVGTGLRVSAMMHLAGLALKQRLNAQLRAAYDLGVSVRGLFGEGTRSLGDLFQVSNEVTLGLSEREIVERVRSVAQYLLREERAAREELVGEERSRLVETATRSLGILQGARSVTPGQAITLMSPLRLAAALGLVGDCPSRLFNELMVGMQVGAGEDCSVGMERAALLRDKLTGIHILSG